MFEVEQNFTLSSEQRARLLEDAAFLGEKTFTDVYFDTAEFALTTTDWWLRRREGRFELKIPIGMTAESVMDQYQEVEDDAAICRALGWPEEGTFEEKLSQKKFASFCTCTTTRKTYLNEGFTIVFDHVTYADCAWSFDTCEIELLTARREDMDAAAARITDFAARHGLRSEVINGKVVQYLFRERPVQFRALVDHHVIAP